MLDVASDNERAIRFYEKCGFALLRRGEQETIFATKVIQEQRISFEIVADPFYSRANMERLEKAETPEAECLELLTSWSRNTRTCPRPGSGVRVCIKK